MLRGLLVALVSMSASAAWAAETGLPSLVGARSVEKPVGGVVDRVAAVVNDDIVLQSEVVALGGSYIEEAVARSGPPARAAAEREVLDKLIERALVQQTVSKLGLDVSETELDRTVDDIAKRNNFSREQLRAEIEKTGGVWSTYRTELSESLREMKFAQSVLRPRVTIAEDELRDAFRRATKDAPMRAHVQAIFLTWTAEDAASRQAVLDRAEALRAQVTGGADFVELSKIHDQGPFGAQNGDMGTFGAGELVSTLDVVVQATATGQVTAPIASERGVFLLRVADRSAGGMDFEAMRAQLTDTVFQTRMEDEKERWFEEARRGASIRVVLPSLAP